MVQEMFDDFFGYSKEQVQPSQNVTIDHQGRLEPSLFFIAPCDIASRQTMPCTFVM